MYRAHCLRLGRFLSYRDYGKNVDMILSKGRATRWLHYDPNKPAHDIGMDPIYTVKKNQVDTTSHHRENPPQTALGQKKWDIQSANSEVPKSVIFWGAVLRRHLPYEDKIGTKWHLLLEIYLVMSFLGPWYDDGTSMERRSWITRMVPFFVHTYRILINLVPNCI